MKKWKIERNALFYLAGILSWNLITYYLTRVFNGSFYHYDFSIGIDSMIPCLSIFAIPYVLSYAEWFFGYWWVATKEESFWKYFFHVELLAKTLALVIFMVVPTRVVRMDVVGSSFTDHLLKLIYACDSSDNLFPSIHCLESYVILRAVCAHTDSSKWFKGIMVIITILIFLSTLFTKQHVFVDVLGAVMIVEIAMRFIKKK